VCKKRRVFAAFLLLCMVLLACANAEETEKEIVPVGVSDGEIAKREEVSFDQLLAVFTCSDIFGEYGETGEKGQERYLMYFRDGSVYAATTEIAFDEEKYELVTFNKVRMMWEDRFTEDWWAGLTGWVFLGNMNKARREALTEQVDSSGYPEISTYTKYEETDGAQEAAVEVPDDSGKEAADSASGGHFDLTDSCRSFFLSDGGEVSFWGCDIFPTEAEGEKGEYNIFRCYENWMITYGTTATDDLLLFFLEDRYLQYWRDCVFSNEIDKIQQQ